MPLIAAVENTQGIKQMSKTSALEALGPLGVSVLWDGLPPLVGQVLRGTIKHTHFNCQNNRMVSNNASFR